METNGIIPAAFFDSSTSSIIHHVLTLLTSGTLLAMGVTIMFLKDGMYDDDTFSMVPLVNTTLMLLCVVNLILGAKGLMNAVQEDKESFMVRKIRDINGAIVLICATIIWAYADAVGKAVCPTLKADDSVVDANATNATTAPPADSGYDYLSWVNNAEGCPESCTNECGDDTEANLIAFVIVGFIVAIVQRLIIMGISVKEILQENCPEDKLGFAEKNARGTYTWRKLGVLFMLAASLASSLFYIMDNDQKLDTAEVGKTIQNGDFKTSFHGIFIGMLVLNIIHFVLAFIGVIFAGSDLKESKIGKTFLKVISLGQYTEDDECEDSGNGGTYLKFYVLNQIPFIRFLVVNTGLVLVSTLIGQSLVFDQDIQWLTGVAGGLLLADIVANHDF